MSAAAAPVSSERAYTPEVLLNDRYAGFELVDGELVEKGMGAEASTIAVELGAILRAWNVGRRYGHQFEGECGYQCFPDAQAKVRKPDLSFIRRERLPAGKIPKGHLRIRPDLAVEVISPNELSAEVEEKILEYRSIGVPLIWVVHPESRSVEVIAPDGTGVRLAEGDTLTGGDVLTGFSCRVADLFEF
jgi:Uma2 family endonuclease